MLEVWSIRSIEIKLVGEVVLEHLLDGALEIRSDPAIDFGSQERLSVD